MTTAILTPFDFSAPVKAGRRRFWKQILPVTEIDYNGQKVAFDRSFHKDLELSFKEGAYDQVPLVFADSENRHNEDPRNFAGELVAVENRGAQGTWGLIEADSEGARAIKKNPRLGVSARILQDVKKADGRTFPRAIRHVLLTMNPRVTGMGPWQAVDLSDDEDADIKVVDLTAEHYTEGTEMARKAVKRTAEGKIDLSALSDEEFQALLDLATENLDNEDPEEDDEEEIDPDEVEDTTTTPPTKKKKSKTKITVEKESEGDDEEDPEDPEEDPATDLSDSERVARTATHATVRSMQIDLAEEKWQGVRKDYLRAGVPPFLLDLAEPVLKQPEAVTLDLSEGESVDASATIRKMLDGVKGIIDLGPEVGHMVDLSDVHDAQDPDKAFLDSWAENYG